MRNFYTFTLLCALINMSASVSVITSIFSIDSWTIEMKLCIAFGCVGFIVSTLPMILFNKIHNAILNIESLLTDQLIANQRSMGDVNKTDEN